MIVHSSCLSHSTIFDTLVYLMRSSSTQFYLRRPSSTHCFCIRMRYPTHVDCSTFVYTVSSIFYTTIRMVVSYATFFYTVCIVFYVIMHSLCLIRPSSTPSCFSCCVLLHSVILIYMLLRRLYLIIQSATPCLWFSLYILPHDVVFYSEAFVCTVFLLFHLLLHLCASRPT